MNNEFFTQSFQDFATKVRPVDLALYAGVGLVLWVLFQDKLVGLKGLVSSYMGRLNLKLPTAGKPSTVSSSDDNNFFELISSWKRTRDLAASLGCSEAVKAADNMFPYLSPQVCKEKNNVQ